MNNWILKIKFKKTGIPFPNPQNMNYSFEIYQNQKKKKKATLPIENSTFRVPLFETAWICLSSTAIFYLFIFFYILQSTPSSRWRILTTLRFLNLKSKREKHSDFSKRANFHSPGKRIPPRFLKFSHSWFSDRSVFCT